MQRFAFGLAIATLMSTAPAEAQDSAAWLTGSWGGTIANYTYGQPGRILDVSPADGRISCKWYEAGGLVYDAKGCRVDGDTINLETAAGSVIVLKRSGNDLTGTFTLKSGRAFQITMTKGAGAPQVKTSSATLCGQTHDYILYPLPPSLPVTLRNLQGVWLGSWDNSLCSALIVESVAADGTVQAQYIFGAYHPWGIAKPGKSRWSGQVDGRTLKFIGSGGSAIYQLSDTNQLDGEYRDNNRYGASRGNFIKQ